VGLKRRAIRDIDGRGEHILYVLDDAGIFENTHGPARCNLDHDVDIAIGPVVAACARAEQSGMCNAPRLKSGFVLLKRGDDVLSVHGNNIAWLADSSSAIPKRAAPRRAAPAASRLPARRRVHILLVSYFARARTMDLTVTLSTKGQLILPKSIRQRRRWEAGTRLVVEETAEGVLLKSAPIFEPSNPDEVFGSLKISGPPKTLEEMDAGILAEAKRRHACD
jgi:AbrB family looped-hinge helix DNA binding protein